MTTIRTKCPTCGEVDMGAGAISLFLENTGDRGAFAFTCPECLEEVSKPASRKTVALLIAAGVEPASVDEGLELGIPWLTAEDRSPDPDAPAFCLDDVIRFHFLLEDDAVIEELLSHER
jgi:predicted RNA-binding Zn-ribbon protein involved in translation (DUF1610 family)